MHNTHAVKQRIRLTEVKIELPIGLPRIYFAVHCVEYRRNIDLQCLISNSLPSLEIDKILYTIDNRSKYFPTRFTFADLALCINFFIEFEMRIAAFTAITICFVSLLLSVVEGQWLNFGGNAQRQARSNSKGDPSNYYSWTLSGVDSSSSPVISSNGTVFVILGNGSTCALNGKTGQVKWITDSLPGASNSGPALSPDEQTLYMAYSTTLHAFDATYGIQLWTFRAASDIKSTPVVGPDGTVYFGSSDGTFHALNGSTGEVQWSYNTTHGEIKGSAALGWNGRVLLLGGDGYLYSFYANGTLDWEYQLGVPSPETIGNPSVSDDGTIFAGDFNGLFAFLPNGTQLWNNTNIREIVSSPALGWNDCLYIGSLNNFNISCIHQSNGTERWSIPVYPQAILSTGAVAYDGRVYLSSIYDFYCIDGDTGAIMWNFTAASGILSSPAIGPDGSVYLITEEPALFAFLGTSVIIIMLISDQSIHRQPQEQLELQVHKQ
jgi:outer membrane protein assembly factor BamB